MEPPRDAGATSRRLGEERIVSISSLCLTSGKPARAPGRPAWVQPPSHHRCQLVPVYAVRVADDLASRLRGVYRDLHTHPELSSQEHRTAGIAAAWLKDSGFEVIEGIATTGVAGVLRNGEGPAVLLRADMDALPVQEATGLGYASQVDGVMHACGHDMHVTCLLGAASALAASRADWSGTVITVFQPAEETAAGATGMVADGLFDRVPRPDVVLGQHVAPLPAGTIGLRAGPAFAATDALRIMLYGAGGHGSRPETTVDPVVMAAATVMRLQGIVAREVSATDMAVVTIGAMRAGTKNNIIPDDAELLLSIRSYDTAVRAKVLKAIERIVHAEARASGATREPQLELMESAPAVINDTAAAARTHAVLAGVVGAGRLVDPGPVTGSEDVGVLAAAAGAPIVFWLLGGADPAAFAGASGLADIARIVAGLPSNHSPLYAPVEDPTIRIGTNALLATAREWLTRPAG
jgi:amidohydrolase